MRRSPKFASSFSFSSNSHVDAELIVGSIIFGIGWGMSGLCIGPAMIDMFVFTSAIFYMPCMAIGQILYDKGFLIRSMKKYEILE